MDIGGESGRQGKVLWCGKFREEVHVILLCDCNEGQERVSHDKYSWTLRVASTRGPGLLVREVVS